MKKMIIAACAFAALAMTSCQESEVNSVKDVETCVSSVTLGLEGERAPQATTTTTPMRASADAKTAVRKTVKTAGIPSNVDYVTVEIKGTTEYGTEVNSKWTFHKTDKVWETKDNGSFDGVTYVLNNAPIGKGYTRTIKAWTNTREYINHVDPDGTYLYHGGNYATKEDAKDALNNLVNGEKFVNAPKADSDEEGTLNELYSKVYRSYENISIVNFPHVASSIKMHALNDLQAIRIHKDPKMGVDMYIMKPSDFKKVSESFTAEAKNEAVFPYLTALMNVAKEDNTHNTLFYHNCAADWHKHFVTLFQHNQFVAPTSGVEPNFGTEKPKLYIVAYLFESDNASWTDGRVQFLHTFEVVMPEVQEGVIHFLDCDIVEGLKNGGADFTFRNSDSMEFEYYTIEDWNL